VTPHYLFGHTGWARQRVERVKLETWSHRVGLVDWPQFWCLL